MMFEWPPWLVVAQAEEQLGVAEIEGLKHNPRILLYHDETTLDASTDEVPWCSSFVNYCLNECLLGLRGTRSARARSWLEYGVPLEIPPIGAIVILKRGGGGQPGPEVIDAVGHVGFFVGRTSYGCLAGIELLGGNQNDRVSVERYPTTRVLGYRWPKRTNPGGLI